MWRRVLVIMRERALSAAARRRRRAGLVAAIVAAALVTNAAIGSLYTVVAPGSAVPLRPFVRVEGATDARAVSRGAFLITTVATSRANILSPIVAAVSPTVELVPTKAEIPEGVDMRDYLRIMDLMMEESQMVARVVALRRAGYDARLDSVVRVEEVLPGSPSLRLLYPGDVIESVDGVRVATARDVVARIQARKPGDPVTIGFLRQGERGEVRIRTVKRRDEEGTHAAISVLIAPHPTYSAPLDVSIRVGDIKGSSAGCMFCLEILDQLLPQDLTRGYRVAGTGTIQLDGKVGPIAGVRQKLASAKRAGAEVFLVPRDNLAEALSAAGGLRVIGVGSLDEALGALASLPTRTTPGRGGADPRSRREAGRKTLGWWRISAQR